MLYECNMITKKIKKEGNIEKNKNEWGLSLDFI